MRTACGDAATSAASLSGLLHFRREGPPRSRSGLAGESQSPGDSAQGGATLSPDSGGYRAAPASPAPSSDPGSRSVESLGASPSQEP